MFALEFRPGVFVLKLAVIIEMVCVYAKNIYIQMYSDMPMDRNKILA